MLEKLFYVLGLDMTTENIFILFLVVLVLVAMCSSIASTSKKK